MSFLKGESIVLCVKTANGVDDFGHEAFTIAETSISNVLIGQPSSEDVNTEISLSGKRIAYTLAIPKGDNHVWENTDVIIRGKKYRTIGIPVEYTEGAMPSWWEWNKQVKVEHYE